MATEHDDAEIIAAARVGFLDEAADMLHQFEQALLVMETAPDDAENLNAAFRAAHTIKGTAGLFGCDAVVAFTHEVETLLEALRGGELEASEPLAHALLEGRDQIGALIDEVRTGAADPDVRARSESLGARLRALRGAAAPVAAVSTTSVGAPAGASVAGWWQISLRFGVDALRNGLDPLAFLRYLGSLGPVECQTLDPAVPALEELDAEACYLGFELRLFTDKGLDDIEQVFEFARDDCELVIHPPAAAPAPVPVPAAPVPTPEGLPAERRGSRDRRPEETRFVKVRADKLDHLIDLIGELVIAGSGAQMVAVDQASPTFLEATQRVSELVQATRDGALALRMVPVGETFSRFSRVVRDIGKQLGKEIELVVTGGDTELDKAMVDVIGDPLMHLVRNSLDHGIETPAERTAAGKNPVGRLGLNAYHEAGVIVIEVSDDGGGLSRERIVKKALERGLVAPEAELDDAAVWQLIFAPGFSTKDAVTDLSGRGVGMDVVKRNIESLRGQISLASTEGRGTTTQIRLPLTLAMIDGFLTQVGGVHYVLPLAVVSECIDLPRECQEQPGRTVGNFDLRGEVLPYLDLALFYGAETTTASAAATPAAAVANPRRSLVVVRQGAVRIGLVVDRLLGEHQTVIKPLATIFKPLEALAGSTILGSGDVALVLDMQGLMAAASRVAGTRRRPARPAQVATGPLQKEPT